MMMLNSFSSLLRKAAARFPVERKFLTSYPFLSGDIFASIAGTLYFKNNIDITNIVTGGDERIVYIDVDIFNDKELATLMAMMGGRSKLILHNGDAAPDLAKIRYLINSQIEIFATNVSDGIPGLTPIPIGIENAHYFRNGDMYYYNGSLVIPVDADKTNEVLVSFSLGTNYDVRSAYASKAYKYGYKNTINYSLSNYREMLYRSMFVIAPPGNGIDCHRAWEAFYHRCVPVIEKKYWNFSTHSIPVLLVDDLDSFFSLSFQEKCDLYKNITRNSYKATYFPYWLSIILN